MSESLAIKYRPKTWDDVTEQNSTKIILQNQLNTNSVKNAYLFCGPAGCGKTTCARIFANEINKGQGNPIELDAASNNGVDDVRNIIQQAKMQSLDSEYKIFIIDECHALSNSAWQAMLKIIEEPPAKSIFIFCTTDPHKIPKTIISRVQRYEFQRISHNGIVNRLNHILCKEQLNVVSSQESIEYIAKLADGGMRDAITLLDKCLSYSKDLTLENVVKALDVVDYDVMFKLTDSILHRNSARTLEMIETMYFSGVDLKQFISLYMQFVINICKYMLDDKLSITIPKTEENVKHLNSIDNYDDIIDLLQVLVDLNADIKYSSTVRFDIESQMLLFIARRSE